MPIGREGNVKWVDGLRGIASFTVVLSHLTRAWNPDLFFPLTTPTTPHPRLLQLPVLRILTQGRLGVLIFAMVTGYVCALKPLRLAAANQHEAALRAISHSALRRLPRLALPAALATALSWVLAELGLYAVARAHADSVWLANSTPACLGTARVALAALGASVVRTWTSSQNVYDWNQWTLLPLVRGSLWVYVFLVATVGVRPAWRMAASGAMWVYFYLSADFAFGMQFFWGTLLADVQNHGATMAFIARRPRTSSVLAVVFVLIGLAFASFPEANAEWAGWSNALLGVMNVITPAFTDIPRFASGVGLQFLSAGIVLSPSLQRALSSRHLLFLGRMSFAVYLIHGTLMKTTLVWMVLGTRAPPDQRALNGEMMATQIAYPGDWTLIAWQLVWLPKLYGLAYLWTLYVDPWCERMTNRLVGFVKLGAGEKVPVLPTETVRS